MKNENKKIVEAIEELGLQGVASVCGVTYQAVRKWKAKGRLPRTEWTGETNYALRIEKATNGKIKQSDLCPGISKK
ncbi:YdaS family helix-turn-helix protein [Sansalvadorimonas verongulae]|uniref:YdaS family helix-turn-helix protein n=1 Tax=Sansalvadorimonas verongulae TaxID=2172824 RepID=UPI0012BCCD8F|nr:YdaS family helix-turn-helix protein [Sansalvadorimonas verongulae]MTI13804.1 DNA-binding protein [Sansalvadorimonas verongulae]